MENERKIEKIVRSGRGRQFLEIFKEEASFSFTLVDIFYTKTMDHDSKGNYSGRGKGKI